MKLHMLAAILSTTALMTPPALAQQAAASTPASAQSDAEIIVTAQKRSENVQKVPISVTVISADQLVRRGVQGIQDLSQASASLEFTAPSAAPGGGAFIRGLGTNLLGGASVSPSVSIVLDGVVLNKANVTDIFDTERVEVLKGPQGTLFGGSVSAGLINMTTVAPKYGVVSGYLDGEFALDGLGSEYNRRLLRGAINLPVSEKSALRIAVQAYNNDGFVTDAYNGQPERLTSIAVRARYKAELGDSVTFNLIGDYDQIHDNNQGLLLYRAATPGSPIALANAACGIQIGPNNTQDCDDTYTFTHSGVGGVSGQFDVALGGATLTSITAWRQRNDTSQQSIEDIAQPLIDQFAFFCDNPANGCLPTTAVKPGPPGYPQFTRNNLISQELRINSAANHHFEWVAGLYFQRSAYYDLAPSLVAIRPFPPAVPAPDIDVVTPLTPTIQSAHLEDYAAFGNATFYIDTATRLIGGLRFTHSTVNEVESDVDDTNIAAFIPGRATADVLTWRAGVQHDFTPTTMAYFTASTGYKAPEINDGATKLPTGQTNSAGGNQILPMNEVYAERPTNFELGLKVSTSDHKLNIDVDLFYTDIHNFQSQSCIPGGSAIICSNLNVPSVHDKGIEWDIFGRPLTGMTVNISGIVSDAKYPAGFFGADGVSMAGYQLNYDPKFKMTASLEQEIPLSQEFALVLGGDVTIRSSQSMYLSANPEFVVPATTIFNARATIKMGEKYSLSFFGRNLGNQIYPVQLYPTSAFATGGLWQVLDGNSRRTLGLQFHAKF